MISESLLADPHETFRLAADEAIHQIKKEKAGPAMQGLAERRKEIIASRVAEMRLVMTQLEIPFQERADEPIEEHALRRIFAVDEHRARILMSQPLDANSPFSRTQLQELIDKKARGEVAEQHLDLMKIWLLNRELRPLSRKDLLGSDGKHQAAVILPDSMRALGWVEFDHPEHGNQTVDRVDAGKVLIIYSEEVSD